MSHNLQFRISLKQVPHNNKDLCTRGLNTLIKTIRDCVHSHLIYMLYSLRSLEDKTFEARINVQDKKHFSLQGNLKGHLPLSVILQELSADHGFTKRINKM